VSVYFVFTFFALSNLDKKLNCINSYFCIKAKSAFFRVSPEFAGRGAAEVWQQARIKGTVWQRCILNFLNYRTNYKAKDIIGKITNLFCIYLFQIDKFINTF
jgi:hypothetical protein